MAIYDLRLLSIAGNMVACYYIFVTKIVERGFL